MTKYHCEKCGALKEYSQLYPVENGEGELFFVCKGRCKEKKEGVTII